MRQETEDQQQNLQVPINLCPVPAFVSGGRTSAIVPTTDPHEHDREQGGGSAMWLGNENLQAVKGALSVNRGRSHYSVSSNAGANFQHNRPPQGIQHNQHSHTLFAVQWHCKNTKETRKTSHAKSV